MTTYNKSYADTAQQIGGVPYGNKTTLRYTMAVNASGIMADSDKATAIVATDVIRLGVIPAGALITDAKAIVSGAMTATATADIGFLYCDSVDTTPAQDPDFFFDALAYNATGLTRLGGTTTGVASATAPITLPKAAYLVLTNNTATLDEAGQIDIFIDCVLTGDAS